MKIFSLWGWIKLSVACGGLKKSLQEHCVYRAVFFECIEDREAFLELCQEEYPNETFFVGTVNQTPAIQCKT